VPGNQVMFIAQRADPITPDPAPRLRTKNLGNLLALDTANLGQCPTQWQKYGYPRRYHSILQVIHEGIDTQVAVPDSKARLAIPNSSRRPKAQAAQSALGCSCRRRRDASRLRTT